MLIAGGRGRARGPELAPADLTRVLEPKLAHQLTRDRAVLNWRAMSFVWLVVLAMLMAARIVPVA